MLKKILYISAVVIILFTSLFFIIKQAKEEIKQQREEAHRNFWNPLVDVDYENNMREIIEKVKADIVSQDFNHEREIQKCWEAIDNEISYYGDDEIIKISQELTNRDCQTYFEQSKDITGTQEIIEALEAFRIDDRDEVKKKITISANAGNLLGMYFYNHIWQDTDEGTDFVIAACKRGFVAACFELYIFSVNADIERTVIYALIMSSELEYPIAMHFWVDYLEKRGGRNIAAEYAERAFVVSQRNAEKGRVSAMESLAFAYAYKNDVKNYLYWWEKAATEGYWSSVESLVDAYEALKHTQYYNKEKHEYWLNIYKKLKYVTWADVEKWRGE